MKRKIISIDEEKCNGCGLCIQACHEGALELVDGKAKLVSESYCDGLGDCLPQCPTGAISIEERVAAPFDEEAVKERTLRAKQDLGCGCPGTQVRMIKQKADSKTPDRNEQTQDSQLRQWPCQLRLVPASAAYLDNAHILIAADCAAYAYANFHGRFMENKITLISCPKLDDTDYADKLTEILHNHNIKSITDSGTVLPKSG
jgi:ferredoxin